MSDEPKTFRANAAYIELMFMPPDKAGEEGHVRIGQFTTSGCPPELVTLLAQVYDMTVGLAVAEIGTEETVN